MVTAGRAGKEEVSKKVCLAYTYDTQINATQYAEEIWVEEVKPIRKKKNAEVSGEKTEALEAIRRAEEAAEQLRRQSVTEGVRERLELRNKVLKWKEERQRTIKRSKKWGKEIIEAVSDSSDDGNENVCSSNENSEQTEENKSIEDVQTEQEDGSSEILAKILAKCQKDLPAEEILAKDRKEVLVPVSENKEPKECVQKGEERKIDEILEKKDLVKEEVAGVVHCKEKFMVENEWSARELIEQSVHKFDSGKEVKESVEKCETNFSNVANENGEKGEKRPKREKSTPRRMKKKTPPARSKSEPVEDDQSDKSRGEKRSPNIVQEGWKEVVERVKRQRLEQEMLDEKKRKADAIKAETQKKEEKLRRALEEARLVEERETEQRRAAALAEAEAEEQRWLMEEKKRKELHTEWQESVDRIKLQVAKEAIKEQERERERQEREKEKAKEHAKELDEIQREIEQRGEMHLMVEEYWKARDEQDKQDEDEELSKVLAEEEDWWSGSGREEEQRRVKEVEERVKREVDKHRSIVAREEDLKREMIEKVKLGVAQAEQMRADAHQMHQMHLMRRIEVERERALERSLMSRPMDEVNQETLSDKVRTRVIKRQAEKEQEEEENKRLQERKKVSPLRESLFPNMPIYINFATANSLPGIVGRNLSGDLKNMGWHVWAPRGKNATPDKSQDESWTIQSKNYFLDSS